MIYKFPEVSHSGGLGHETFTTWENAFDDETIENVCNLGMAAGLADAVVGSGNGISQPPTPDIRVSQTSWINYSQESDWLFQKMSYIATQLNIVNWRFDLSGFSEFFQFTVYHGMPERPGHYKWHIDTAGHNDREPRKLSLVLQLSDPSEYEGGDLQFFQHEEITAPKKKGLVVSFPSFVPHRVTPVTAGVRKSLVIWISGPPFK